MPVRFIPTQYLAAAINPASEYLQTWGNNYFYRPEMVNKIGNSQYLLSKDNIPSQNGARLNFLA